VRPFSGSSPDPEIPALAGGNGLQAGPIPFQHDRVQLVVGVESGNENFGDSVFVYISGV
jgi:hypothetical protein